ncbi:unnamed protein product [Acanthoscelides obtectus]|uniref:Uncharacterized protein n=1 Tax=Acanthoscelides obtectus TaxID=200917 RepID=A0A9P0NYE5_ACAOB|nr:unnamed protein product [Acanthoscelides obtectus]CAK1654080.1 hypothetical protein AOBTE_LOCUS18445 [Acanthoscelides obtectus]
MLSTRCSVPLVSTEGNENFRTQAVSKRLEIKPSESLHFVKIVQSNRLYVFNVLMKFLSKVMLPT